jgi:hypothetical protein
MYVKSHVANIVPLNLGPLIPPYVTERAIYVVRDPRDVFPSISKYLAVDPDVMIENFKDDTYAIGMGKTDALVSQICGWSTHVKSWSQEENFPVLVVRYEDMLEDGAAELTKVLKFCGVKVDADIVNKSVEACRLENLQAQEKEHGFVERRTENIERFFGDGGSRWKNKLDTKYVAQIERDHHEAMALMDYELTTMPKLEVG